MKISIKKLPKSRIELEIEVPDGEFNDFVEKATLDLGKELEIEGFRKGKVPKGIIEKEIGQGKILVEAAELAIKENYIRAILENKIEAISQPEIEILKLALGNSLVFKAKTQVMPEINLPDYKKIASGVKRNQVLVTEKEVEDALLWLQKSRAKFTLKNQPAQRGDWVEIEYSSPQVENGKVYRDAFILGEGHFLPGFEESLEGMKSGEEGRTRVGPRSDPNHPEQGGEVLGKSEEFKVKMKSVQNMELPEINDLFAKSLGQFENLTALKKSIKEGISLEKERAESQRVRQEILEKISQKSDLEVPEILIESEKNRMLENLKQNVSQKLKISFEDYLNRIKKTEKEIAESFLAGAQKRVKTSLVLREISKKENIEVSPEEIEEEINKILKHYPNIEKAEKTLDPEKLKEYTEGAIRNEKTLKLLEGLATSQ